MQNILSFINLISFKIKDNNILYDFVASREFDKIIKIASKYDYDTYFANSIMFLKSENYFILEKRLYGWSDVIIEKGLRKIRELKLFPFKNEEIVFHRLFYQF